MTARLAIPGEIVLWCAWLLTLLLIVAGAMISFGRSCWACELLSHFPAQIAAVAVVTSVAFAVVGRLRHIVIPAAVAAWNIGALVPFYASVPTMLVPPPLTRSRRARTHSSHDFRSHGSRSSGPTHFHRLRRTCS